MQQEKVFQEYKSLLFSIAYRMLGSIMGAEDCVQEAFLQWYASDPEKTIENPKAFLCTLVTRRCIDHLRSAQVQREAYVGLWLPDPLIEADPSELSELGESLSLAFLLVLERLSPIERAVFLLRQVFDYNYAEIAIFVGKSEENCRQVMHRAQRHLPLHRFFSQGSKEHQQQVFTQFLRVCQEGDMESLLQVLSDEIVARTDGGGKIGTARNPIRGAGRVAPYLLGIQRKLLHLTIQPMLINGQPGLIGYRLEGGGIQDVLATMSERQPLRARKGDPAFAMALTFAENQIQEIAIIVNPEKLQHIPPLLFDEEKEDCLEASGEKARKTFW